MELLSQLIPSLFEGIFLFDEGGRLAMLNPAAERILGRSERAVAGLSPEALFQRAPDLVLLVRSCLDGGPAVFQGGVRASTPDGVPLFLNASVSPVEAPDGALLGAVLLARDETLQRQLDRTRRRADQLAQLGTLNLGMAHEIRNPLGGIKGATQLLRSELDSDSPLAEHCDIILREVDRIDGLLSGLLSAVRGGPAAFSEVNIHQVLDQVLELVARSEEARGIVLQRVYDPSLPPVRGDRDGLVQVFLNLLKNAVEASPAGGRITVRTSVPVAPSGVSPAPSRGPVLEVDVEDEGPGFDASVTDFGAPFFTTKPKGVGLGLAISEQIVQNHGGGLVLDNREGGGACVRVLLPLGGVVSAESYSGS